MLVTCSSVLCNPGKMRLSPRLRERLSQKISLAKGKGSEEIELKTVPSW
jgi:hypothetical protein